MRVFEVRSLEGLQFHFLGFPRIGNRDSVAAAEGSMRPKKHETTGSGDLFRARLEQQRESNGVKGK